MNLAEDDAWHVYLARRSTDHAAEREAADDGDERPGHEDRFEHLPLLSSLSPSGSPSRVSGPGRQDGRARERGAVLGRTRSSDPVGACRSRDDMTTFDTDRPRPDRRSRRSGSLGRAVQRACGASGTRTLCVSRPRDRDRRGKDDRDEQPEHGTIIFLRPPNARSTPISPLRRSATELELHLPTQECSDDVRPAGVVPDLGPFDAADVNVTSNGRFRSTGGSTETPQTGSRRTATATGRATASSASRRRPEDGSARGRAPSRAASARGTRARTPRASPRG